MNKRAIAIVRMAFRLPGNITTEKGFWKALIEEKDLVTGVDARFDKQKFFHQNSNRAGKSYTFSAGVIPDYDKFD